MLDKIRKGFIGLVLFTIVAVPIYVIAATANLVSSDLTAENTFTSAFTPIQFGIQPMRTTGLFNISISENTPWVGTVTHQRSFDAGTAWHDIQNWTTDTQTTYTDSEPTSTHRLGFKTGDYTSGTATCRLGN